MNIPDKVREEAKHHGNTIRHLGEYDGEQVFSVYTLDKHGDPLPTGMPILVFFNGTKARTEISEANLAVIAHVSAS
jgi:hypothetical protein